MRIGGKRSPIAEVPGRDGRAVGTGGVDCDAGLPYDGMLNSSAGSVRLLMAVCRSIESVSLAPSWKGCDVVAGAAEAAACGLRSANEPPALREGEGLGGPAYA